MTDPGPTDPKPPALCLDDWLTRIGRQHPRPIELGLDRVGAVWRRMGLALTTAVITHCGHCQFGGQFVCKDGPIFHYGAIKSLFGTKGF